MAGALLFCLHMYHLALTVLGCCSALYCLAACSLFLFFHCQAWGAFYPYLFQSLISPPLFIYRSSSSPLGKRSESDTLFFSHPPPAARYPETCTVTPCIETERLKDECISFIALT